MAETETVKKISKDRINKLWILFIVMSILGWIYETVLEVFVWKTGFSNRGMLMLYWLPIYGFGGLLFIGTCYPMDKVNKYIRPFLVFFATALIATAVELLATYVLERTSGSWPWDYTRYDINFQGRIALSTSIRFGLLGLLGYYVLFPLIEKFCKTVNQRVVMAATVITLILFVGDVIFAVLK